VKHRPLPHLESALRLRAEKHLLREPPPRLSAARTFCSNDYLGLAATPLRVNGDASAGAGASRLVCGDKSAHEHLEQNLAAWLELPSALVFASGYAANLGTIAALVQPGDVVFSDRANHASLIDGMRLAKGKVVTYAHNDLRDLASKLTRERSATTEPREGTSRRWVVTESYFSMDADGPDLPALRALCDEMDAHLVLDEAHALGVFGPEGRGLAAAANIVPDVLLGTLGKSMGTQGAFAAGATELTRYLWNSARSFVFSTGISPALAAHADAQVNAVRDGHALRARLHANTEQLRSGMASIGCIIHGHGPIVPWVIGDDARALAIASALLAQGFHAQAIRPPTVPAGSARLRVTTNAGHKPSDIDAFLDALKKVVLT